MIGVIIPLEQTCTPKDADEMHDELSRRFPGVEFCLVAGAVASAVFEFDPYANEPQ